MRTCTLICLAAAGALLATARCHAAAGRVFVGMHDRLHQLTDVSLEGPKGEALALAFKTRSLFLGLGIYCQDEGYVLRDKTDPDRYFVLPKPELERWQAKGLLPRPLPSYNVPAWEYLAGYSLWWVALLAAGYLKLKERFTRARRPSPLEPVPSRSLVRP